MKIKNFIISMSLFATGYCLGCIFQKKKIFNILGIGETTRAD